MDKKKTKTTIRKAKRNSRTGTAGTKLREDMKKEEKAQEKTRKTAQDMSKRLSQRMVFIRKMIKQHAPESKRGNQKNIQKQARKSTSQVNQASAKLASVTKTLEEEKKNKKKKRRPHSMMAGKRKSWDTMTHERQVKDFEDLSDRIDKKFDETETHNENQVKWAKKANSHAAAAKKKAMAMKKAKLPTQRKKLEMEANALKREAQTAGNQFRRHNRLYDAARKAWLELTAERKALYERIEKSFKKEKLDLDKVAEQRERGKTI